MSDSSASFSWLVWAAKVPDAVPDASCLAVLVVLAEHANAGGHAWPSIDTLSKCTRLAERTVQRSLRRLEDVGLIVSEQRPGTSTSYRLQRPGGVTESPRHSDTPVIATPRHSDGGVMVTGEGCHGDGGGVSQSHPRGVTVTPEQPNEQPNEQPSEQPTPREGVCAGEFELTSEPEPKPPPSKPPKHDPWDPPAPWSEAAVRLGELALELSASTVGCRRKLEAWAPGIEALLTIGAQRVKGRNEPDGEPPTPDDVERALTALWSGLYEPDGAFDWRAVITDGAQVWRKWAGSSGWGARMLGLAAKPSAAFSWDKFPHKAKLARGYILAAIHDGAQPDPDDLAALREALTEIQYAWAVEDMRKEVPTKEAAS